MDRLVRGFIIGVIGSLIKGVINWFSYGILHITKKTYGHFMAGMIYGRPVANNFDLFFAQLVEMGFSAMLGVAFIYYAYRTENKRNLWFKGIMFGTGAYLFFYAIGTFFKVPALGKISTATAISSIVTSAIYGLVIGVLTYWWGKKRGDFERKTPEKKIKRFKLSPQTARKIIADDKTVKLKKPTKLR